MAYPTKLWPWSRPSTPQPDVLDPRRLRLAAGPACHALSHALKLINDRLLRQQLGFLVVPILQHVNGIVQVVRPPMPSHRNSRPSVARRPSAGAGATGAAGTATAGRATGAGAAGAATGDLAPRPRGGPPVRGAGACRSLFSTTQSALASGVLPQRCFKVGRSSATRPGH